MKLTFDDGIEAFRREFTSWLAEHAPTPDEMAAEPRRSSSHVPGWAGRWTRRMFDAGWLVPGWPAERGGRNAGPIETLVYLEELVRAKIPRTTNPQGLGIVAPSIFDHGDSAQIEQYAMPILRGEKSACLGMSEPGAGSDLAALSTRATLDGDHYVINGQKLWTSGAQDADFCFLFCRTDPSAAKHRGISVILVDMDTRGVSVRPVQDIIHPGTPDLNEVFFDNVVVPASQLVGSPNNGWAMANSSLAHERGMVWLNAVLELEDDLGRLLGEAPSRLASLSVAERAVLADAVAASYVDSLAARALGYRGFAKLVRGGNAPEQALMKAFCSESARRLSLAATELSADHAVDIAPHAPGSRQRANSWIERYFDTFGSTISAGSSEIQRNIIAEKVLGLPRG